jgi:tRNA pseudouridine38-40 synthase
MRRIKFTIEYNGAGYHGWQIQKDHRTVQGILQKALHDMLHHRVKVVGASRTDAGVHSMGQVAHFDTSRDIPVHNIQRGLNSLIPADMAVIWIEEVDQEFHARYSAVGKDYEYKCFLRPWKSPFMRKFAWHVPRNLDVTAMQQAARYIEGEHDFSSFRSASCAAASPVRRLHSVTLTREQEILLITLSGTGFLQHMVRVITGTLVDIGSGRLSPEDMRIILESRDRSAASKTAPPDGLYLVKVYY